MTAFLETLLLGVFLLGSIFLARRADRHPRLSKIGMWWIGILGGIFMIEALLMLSAEERAAALPPAIIALGLFGLLMPRLHQEIGNFLPISTLRFLHIYLIALLWIAVGQSVGAFFFPDPIPTSITLFEIGLQETFFILGSFLALGFLNGIPLNKIASRLGLTRISKALLLRAFLATLGMYGLLFSAILITEGILQLFGHSFTTMMDQPPTTTRLLEELINPATILLVPLMVALGEEILFRGLLQPLLGFLPTAAFFVLVHMPQNAFHPAAFFLLIPSFTFGWLRMRYGLSTAIVSHALYDSGLLTLAATLPAGEEFLAYG